jgi:hypothetical protein
MPFSFGDEWARITWLKTWAVDAPVLQCQILCAVMSREDDEVQSFCDRFELRVVLALHCLFVVVSGHSLLWRELHEFEAVCVEIEAFVASAYIANDHGSCELIVVV